VGMGTLPFFHSSTEYFNKNIESKDTSRMRIEHSRFIKSIDEERKFLIEGEGDKCDLIRDIININAESFVRPIPFSDVWNTYWENINHHLFMFNE